MPDPLFIDDDDANTPLTAEEREQLIPAYITLRHELNEAEQINIGQALRWTTARKRDVLDQKFLRQLHKRMFGDVWRWAGQYRTSARNIGVDPYRITTDVHQAIGLGKKEFFKKKRRVFKKACRFFRVLREEFTSGV